MRCLLFAVDGRGIAVWNYEQEKGLLERDSVGTRFVLGNARRQMGFLDVEAKFWSPLELHGGYLWFSTACLIRPNDPV